MKQHWFLPEEKTNKYLELCKRAALDDNVFANFRNHPVYTLIVDNGNEEGAKRLFYHIMDNYREMYNELTVMRSTGHPPNIDILGNPKTYKLDGQYFSNTRLRYIKIIAELHHYGLIKGTTNEIIEIGGGFGGLAVIISYFLRYNLPMYSIYDLYEVSVLQSVFTERIHFNNIAFKSEIKEPENDIDLVIAICSYSELSRELQDEYIDKVISKAKYGYFHLNNGVEEQANYLRSRLKDKEIIARDIFSDEPINQSIFIFKPKQ